MAKKKFPKAAKVLIEESVKTISPSVGLIDLVTKAMKQYKKTLKTKDAQSNAVKARYGKAVMKKRGGTFKGTF